GSGRSLRNTFHMKPANRTVGDTGEGVACRYLESKGYKVLERNYLKPWGEIDIVAEKAKKLYFVEVKTVSREPKEGYRPEENVHPAKLKRLHRAIQTYILDHKVLKDVDFQIDVACVYLDFSTKKAKVEMLENVIL
ncbi:YraN family protein, partial [Candidatus Parcubacteria bacterium]|nr:YraN family protein [Candidatus Parcubacteria bacterium]